MAFHISEIGIRIAIGEAAGPKELATPGGGDPSPAALTDAQRDALVQECVRNVLATLHLMERR